MPLPQSPAFDEMALVAGLWNTKQYRPEWVPSPRTSQVSWTCSHSGGLLLATFLSSSGRMGSEQDQGWWQSWFFGAAWWMQMKRFHPPWSKQLGRFRKGKMNQKRLHHSENCQQQMVELCSSTTATVPMNWNFQIPLLIHSVQTSRFPNFCSCWCDWSF